MKQLLRATCAAALGLAIAGAWTAAAAHADDGKKTEKRRKELEFDDGLIEGVNKRQGEFASKATNWKARKRDHLYNKNMSFERDLDETVREARYSR